MRMAMEMEYIYASTYPFVDYGIDLDQMADEERGVRLTRFSTSPTDTDKTTDKLRANPDRQKRMEEMG